VDGWTRLIAASYVELVEDGETAAYSLMNDSSLERLNQWCCEIGALTVADGLRAKMSAEAIGAGSFLLPYAFLLRPDGSNYPWRTVDDRIIPGASSDHALLEADWGAILVAARANAALAATEPT
jgi:hypothetical protein